MNRATAAVALILVGSGGLRADPPARVDSHGNPLPPGAVARLGSARLRHAGSVRDVVFSPDGARLAVTSEDGRVTVWETDTGRLVCRADAGGLPSVAFGADGKTVGTFAEKVGFRVFDRDTGRRRSEDRSALKIDTHENPALQPKPVLAPGLRWMAYRTGERENCRVVVIDPASERHVTSYPLRHHGWATQVVFSPDGGRLGIGDADSGNTTVWVCDPTVGRVVFEQKVEGVNSTAVALSRDGTRVAVVTRPHATDTPPAAARVWDTATGQLLRAVPVRDSLHESMAFSPDGRTLALLGKEHGPPPRPYDWNNVIRLIDVANGEVVGRFVTRVEHGRLSYSPDGRWVAVAAWMRVEVFETATGRVVPGRDDEFEPEANRLHAYRAVEFRPDGTLLVRPDGNDGLEVWNPLTGRRTDVIPLPPDGTFAHTLSPDGKRLVYSACPGHTDGERRLWDRGRKADVARATYPGVVLPRFDFTADSRRLFMHPQRAEPAASDVWELDPATLAPVRGFELGRPFHNVPLWDGRVAAGGLRRFDVPVGGANPQPTGTIRQWDLTTGKEGAVIRWAPDATADMGAERVGDVRWFEARAASADGRWIAVYQFIGRRGPGHRDNQDRITGDRFLCVYDTSDGRERARFVVSPDPAASVEGHWTPAITLSPDGRLVAVAGAGSACRVFEVATGAERRKLTGWTGSGSPGQYNRVADVQFSPDGRFLLTTSAADGVLVWDAAALAPPRPVGP